jgi:hypothetical protein
MRALDIGLLLAACAGAVTAAAQTSLESRNLQADCELDYIKDTRSPLGVQLITNACNILSRADTRLHRSQRAYAQCILAVIPGSQSNAASSQLAAACQQRYPLY